MAKQKKTPVEIAFEHLSDLSAQSHRMATRFSVELEIAKKMDDPDLISALEKLIAYENKTQASLSVIGEWFRVISATNRSVRDVIGTLESLQKEVTHG